MLLVSVGAFSQTRLDYFMLQAGKCRLNGHWSEAIALYNHCLEIEPNSAEALYQLGKIRRYLRQDSLGIEMIRKAIDIDSLNPYYQETLAALLLRSGKDADALPLLEKMSRLQSKRTDILSHIASLQNKLGKTDDAIKTLNRMETLEGKTADLSYEKFSLYIEKGDSAEAFRELQSLCDEFPADMNYRIRLAYQYQQRGNYEKARQIYDEVRKTDPTNTDLQMAMLDYYQQNGMDSVYIATRDSILLSPGTAPNYRATIMQMVVQNSKSDSLANIQNCDLFERVLKVDSTDIDLYTLYAAYLNYRQMPDSCISSVLHRILRQAPDNEMATQWLVQYYVGRKNYSELEEICRRGTNYHPEELVYSYFLGMILVEQSRRQEAIDVLKKGLERRPHETSSPTMVSDMFSIMGDMYFRLNNVREAYCQYDSALIYNKDNVSCMNNYAYYLSLENDKLDKAEEMSYRVIKAEPGNKTYLDTYAWILFMQHRYSEAQKYMDQVISPDSTDSVLLSDEDLSCTLFEHAGDIAWMNGNPAQAARFWSLAVQTDDKEDITQVLLKKNRKHKYFRK